MATLAELVLRRRLKSRNNELVGILYEPGQHSASIIGDEAIVSFVDSGGWAIQAFLQRDGDDWALKSDIIMAVNPYGMECRRVGRGFPLAPSIQTALRDAEAKGTQKKGAANKKSTTPDPPTE